MQLNGLFIIAEFTGPAATMISEINRMYDPRLARYKAPHVTVAGSSGVGPLPPSVEVGELRKKLSPITSTTEVMTLELKPPARFMGTDIVILPLEPNGPLRILHDRIAMSGLPFQRARFTFSPHVTLSLYPTLTREAERQLLSIRIREPITIDSLTVYHTMDPQPAKKLLHLPLLGRVMSRQGSIQEIQNTDDA